MNHKFFLCAVLFTMLFGCGSDRDSASLVQGANGSASLGGDAVVGGTLSATVADSDGIEAGTETYQWFSDSELIAGATTSSYTLTSSEGGESVTVVVRYTDGAGLRETAESAPTSIQAAFNLGARYVHGLVDGAQCDLFAVDATGVAGGTALASGTTSNGLAAFGDLVPVDGTALISCNGGTYTDEATGLVLDAPATRAVVNVDGNATFTVSPLTEVAAQLADAAGDLNTAIATHNASVAVNFGISGDITVIQPTDLTTTAAADDDAGRYATALALISQVDATDATATAADIINSLGAELAVGPFTPATVDAFNAAVTALAMSPVAANLDSTALAVVESAINNAPEPAVFEGLDATIPNDQVEDLTGMVVVTDVNFGEDRVVAQSGVQTTYGTFSIEESGAWTYKLNTENETVASLEVGASVNDTIGLSSPDGTMANLVIRVTALTQVAAITNTINGDTGELRYNLENNLRRGKLTFSFLKTEALADDGNQKDAYITLYGSSGSSAESLFDLRIQGEAVEDDGSIRAPRFLVRNTESPAYPGGIITAPFNPNEFYNIEIMWDMAQENQITILINGEVLGGGPFSTPAVVDPDFTSLDQWFDEGVRRVQWRFGDNGSTIPFGTYYVDNIVLFSDTAGTTPVFMDDFETNNVGDSLVGSQTYPDSIDAVVEVFDAGAPIESVAAAFFNLVAATASDSTELLTGMVNVIDPDPGEALIVEQTAVATEYGTFSILPSGAWEYTLDTANPTITALGSGESIVDTIAIASIDGTAAEIRITIRAPVVVPTGLQAAVIRDTDSSDTGELRYDITNQLSGRLEVTYDRTVTGPDAFIALLNSSGSTSSARSIIDMRIKDDEFQFRDQSFPVAPGVVPTPGTLQTVVITWTAPDADTPPTVTVTVDGVNVVDGGGSFTSGAGALGGVERVQFRFGSGSNVSDFVDTFSVESWEVFSDTEGMTSVFADDFSGYGVGNSLDPNAMAVPPETVDPTIEPGTPYSSSSSEVVVESLGGDPVGAVIRDTNSGDTGELRYDIDTQLSGRLEVTYDRTVTGPDAFIALLNSSGSTSSARSIIDMRIKDDEFQFRDQSFVVAPGVAPTPGTLQTVVITWTAPDADTPPTVTVTVDGVNVVDGGGSFTSGAGALGGVERVQFRFGSGSNVSDFVDTFSIESWEVFSDTEGTASVFADDFTEYTIGNSLDPNATAVPPETEEPTIEPGTPYSSSSSEVVVASLAPPPIGAVIRDTNSGDTGELRYDIDNQLSGRLEVTYDRTVTGPDAFIALLNSSGSTSSGRSIIDMRIKDDEFQFRDQSFAVAAGVVPTPGTLQTVVITWTAPDADTLPTVTVTVDGVDVVDGGGSFTSGAGALGGVERVQFRFGSGSNVSDFVDTFSIESWEVFSDTEGSTSVFADDFSTYGLGNSLDPNATAVPPETVEPTIDPGTPYSSSSSEVVVETLEGL
ncbi:MAG: VCBS domain-containing protein [Gammaproteobacteria bacterium]